MSAQPAISVSNLTYFYPSQKALDNVNFNLETGSITALVGPNGAGKSTLMRNLAALETPYAGQIAICGINVHEHPRSAHRKIGYLPDDFGLYEDLAVEDVLAFIGGCHNLTGDELDNRINQIIEVLHLDGVRKQKCSSLSRGWRQRTGIAISTIHKPEILILDEPASGLDPEARTELSTVLKKLQAEGMTILVSSHILAELEEYCTSMLVLRDGKIIDHVSLEKHQQEQQQTITVRVITPISDEKTTIITKSFPEQPPVLSTDKTLMQFSVSHNRMDHHALLKQLIALDLDICNFTLEEKSFQSLYIELAHKNAPKQ